MDNFKGTPGPWIARNSVDIDVIRDHDSAAGYDQLSYLKAFADNTINKAIGGQQNG